MQIYKPGHGVVMVGGGSSFDVSAMQYISGAEEDRKSGDKRGGKKKEMGTRVLL